MQQSVFPLSLEFKMMTLANDFSAKDANGTTVAYVKQKMFKLVEEVNVYADESQNILNYQIKANKWLDFSASYSFLRHDGSTLGRVARKGWASLWKARYEIFDENDNQDLLVQEENAWVKVLDAILGEIPFLGILTGYFFNPSYSVSRPDGTLVARLRKQASFFGRRFEVTKEAEFEAGEEERILLGLMMMILMERRRG